MIYRIIATLALFTMSLSAANASASTAVIKQEHHFEIGKKDFLLDGQPFVIRCGEMHFARIPPEYWRHRLKMAKAMGLNTVCAYFFWNFHEWEEGKYDWSGWRDAAEFCRIAQEEGLWVLVRPGPYSCAEWEMGGLPWWLVKNDNIHLRSTDPKFLEPATRYFKEVARVLAPLQVTHGGPILMMQVENEYGSYGKDTEYMGALRQALIDGGIDVPLFACNPPGAIRNGLRDNLFQVVNFGPGNARKAFETLAKYQKTGPLMNGEYYPAWFDIWGKGHRTTNVHNFIGDLDYMLQNDRSFSIYMAHGGTSFGLWAGADRPFRPDTSSYDYDAPISEAGWPSASFGPLRELFGKHLLPGETLPPIPPANPVITIPAVKLAESASVFDHLAAPITEPGAPKTMEFYGQSRGDILYRTTLPAGPASQLSIRDVHDFAWVFLDGEQVGVMDRRSKRFKITLPARSRPAQLDILVEAMGRVNFGQEIFDRKGLHAPVKLTADDGSERELQGWEVYSLPLSEAQISSVPFQSGPTDGPAYWRGSFDLSATGDTFLDVRGLGKGVLWVNGHCLGRFWNIGPTQTMYCPGPWLKQGRNEIIVLDLVGPRSPEIAGLAQPILDELHPELDFARKQRATGSFTTDSARLVAEATLSSEPEWQDVPFAHPVKGRYLALAARTSIDGKPFASMAELDLVDARGEPLSKSLWKVLWVSSEEISAESGEAENALDGQPATIWHSEYSNLRPDYPHYFVLDLGESVEIGGIRCLPRAGDAHIPGRIKDLSVYVADTSFGLTYSKK